MIGRKRPNIMMSCKKSACLRLEYKDALFKECNNSNNCSSVDQWRPHTVTGKDHHLSVIHVALKSSFKSKCTV